MRVMKARRYSICCQCGGLVKIGQQIAEVDDGWWAHVHCVIKARAA